MVGVYSPVMTTIQKMRHEVTSDIKRTFAFLKSMKRTITVYFIFASFHLCILPSWSSEKQVANEDGGNHSGQIGQQAAGYGMTGVFDVDTAEVDGKNIEGSIGGTLENAG